MAPGACKIVGPGIYTKNDFDFLNLLSKECETQYLRTWWLWTSGKENIIGIFPEKDFWTPVPFPFKSVRIKLCIFNRVISLLEA